MRVAVRCSDEQAVTLPAEFASALEGHREVDVTLRGREVVIRFPAQAALAEPIGSRAAALRAARQALPQGIGFSREEWQTAREATHAAGIAETSQLLRLFGNGDLPT